MPKLWEKDKSSGLSENAHGLSTNSAVFAKRAVEVLNWKLTVSRPVVNGTTGSGQIQELASIVESIQPATSSCSVRRAILSRRVKTAWQGYTGGWRWFKSQQVLVLDELDAAIDEIYRSGLMCQLCRISLFQMDNYVQEQREEEEEI